MSKDLLLLRHAKSSWSNPGIPDRDRVLNNRGRRNAPQMGRALATRLEPCLVHVSPAQRAQRTLGGLQDGWPSLREFTHRTEEALYTFSVTDLVSWIGGQDDACDRLFLIGHNPAFTELINWLCGETVLPNLPTAGFVQLELAVNSWAQLEPGCGQIVTRLFPKELADS
jgi:phosphohistidine phosphatase